MPKLQFFEAVLVTDGSHGDAVKDWVEVGCRKNSCWGGNTIEQGPDDSCFVDERAYTTRFECTGDSTKECPQQTSRETNQKGLDIAHLVTPPKLPRKDPKSAALSCVLSKLSLFKQGKVFHPPSRSPGAYSAIGAIARRDRQQLWPGEDSGHGAEKVEADEDPEIGMWAAPGGTVLETVPFGFGSRFWIARIAG